VTIVWYHANVVITPLVDQEGDFFVDQTM